MRCGNVILADYEDERLCADCGERDGAMRAIEGNSMKTKVAELWWEGSDLHVVTEDGFHIAYENATLHDHKIICDRTNNTQQNIEDGVVVVDVQLELKPYERKT